MTDRVLTAIRKACPGGVWSRGVNLVRAGGVSVESRSDDEIVLRVRSAAAAVAPTVVIYPGEQAGDEDWDCDCAGRARPCEHIAAAAIALGQGSGEADTPAAQASPAAATPVSAAGRVRYRFTSEDHGLRLRRTLTTNDGGDRPLEDSLATLRTRPAEAARLVLNEHDLRADLLLKTRSGGVLPPDKLIALLTVLADADGIFLDDQPVAIARDPITPRATIFDRDDKTVVRIERDPRITRVVAAGVALCDRQLHPLGEIDLAGGWLQNLPSERVFPSVALGELKTRVLPDLQKRMPVDVQSQRLPATVRDLAPRIQLAVEHLGTTLTVLPTIVYGDPPCARIDDGRLVHLGGPVPVRDQDAEQRLRHRLREQLDLLPGRRANFTGAEAARFAERLERFRAELKGGAAAAIEKRARLLPRFAVLASGGEQDARLRVELDFSVEGLPGAGTVSAETVMSAFRDGLGLVPLGEHGFAPLPQDWLARYGDRIADLLAARAPDGQLATHALPLAAELCEAMNQPKPPALNRLATLVNDFTDIPAATLPGDLTAELRPYQRHGVDWLVFLRRAGLGAILADDMGLGKTLQTLCALAGRSLIVCPTSVLGNWRQEIERFRPGLRVNVYHGSNRRLRDDADVTLTSYAILRLDDAVVAQRWDSVVLDEAQAIKNPDSQTAQAAFALQSEFRVALSGTPVENRLEELWSLAHFSNRGLLGGRADFDARYARPIAAGDAQALATLRRRLRPFVLRRLKKDVAPELPPRLETVLHVVLDERERGLYDTLAASARAEVMQLLEGGGGVMAALELLLRLRQAACHVGLLPGQTAPSSSKVERLRAVLEEAVADGHKALVFSQWTTLLDLIEPHLTAAGIGYTRLDGSTRDRDAVVADFQGEGGPPVLLMSLKAGGTGLNLVAADHVFICDPWWNPAAEAQAADRAHRIGQDRPVLIHRLVADDTVEERLLALQEKKRALADAAVGDGGAAAGLGREDLLALLA